MYFILHLQISLDGFSDSVIRYIAGQNDHSDDFLAQLLNAGKGQTSRALACSLFSEIIPTTTLYSQAITHIVNFYLDDDKKEARDDLVRLTSLYSPEAEEKILSYAWEALRERNYYVLLVLY
jgi:linoleate 10R-lipoxygenase